ncbi:MAG: PTS fructose transporter subunit IIA [Burkholderiales bacterium]|nr:PTS fructose transporter subunit IIA [Burkholderiales bacterium]
MVGVLLITHDGIGEALLAGAAHVLGGAPANARAIAVGAGDDVGVVEARARAALAAVDDGTGVMVLADVYGATPSNIGARLLSPGRVAGIAGVSLPMLVRVLASRALPLDQVLTRALDAGSRGQVNMGEDACHGTAGRG